MSDAARELAQVIFLTLALIVLWLACVADVRPDDMCVGVIALFLTVAFSFFAIRRLPIRFRPQLCDIVQVWRLPWYVISGTAEITYLLLRDFFGRRAKSLFRSAPWYPSGNNGHETAQRVLAISYTTVAPNFIIVGIDCERGQMLFHQVEKSSVPIMTQRLGAGGGGARSGA